MVTVSRGAGSSEEGHASPPGPVPGLTGSLPSLEAAPDAGPAGLPERPGHLPPGAGPRPPAGRATPTRRQGAEPVRRPHPPLTLRLLSDAGADERPGHRPGPAGSPWRRSVLDPAGRGPEPGRGTPGPARAPGEPGRGTAARRWVEQQPPPPLQLPASTFCPAGRLEDSARVYGEALNLAQQAGDQPAVEQILEGLTEVKKRRRQEEEGGKA